MNVQYSNEERLFIAMSYQNCKSIKSVQRQFHIKFGQARTPHKRTIKRTHNKLMTAGTILDLKKGNHYRFN
jgi:hypothetical protein